MLRILFTGGGTGGHITPILAVIEELKLIAKNKNINLDLRYFGVPGNFEFILEKEGIMVSKILGGKLRRYFDLRNLMDIPKFFLSIFQLLWMVLWFMPDVLFSKGGPGALVVVLVSRFYRIPVIIHESDAIPGLTNQISGRYAQRIAISFPSAADYFSRNIALVGNPIRRSLFDNPPDQKTAKIGFNFSPDKPLILFIGGSQGATRINDFVLNSLRDLVKDFQILHQVGTENFDEVKSELQLMAKNFTNEEWSRYKALPYFEENMKSAYSAADIIVSRAGSSSIFEVAMFGKPSILIPLPEAAYGHQTKNAYEYANSGAAIVIETDNLKPNLFINEARKLLRDQEKLKSMSEAAQKFAKPEAAKVIAEEIIKLGSGE